mmetsp:Transcript_14027/g.39693  ORF Transcript_14027/g.39693 Transcript_14027/m.39693 type:complete len:401 (+) Transcript_14027:1359-2561(+)
MARSAVTPDMGPQVTHPPSPKATMAPDEPQPKQSAAGTVVPPPPPPPPTHHTPECLQATPRRRAQWQPRGGPRAFIEGPRQPGSRPGQSVYAAGVPDPVAALVLDETYQPNFSVQLAFRGRLAAANWMFYAERVRTRIVPPSEDDSPPMPLRTFSYVPTDRVEGTVVVGAQAHPTEYGAPTSSLVSVLIANSDILLPIVCGDLFHRTNLCRPGTRISFRLIRAYANCGAEHANFLVACQIRNVDITHPVQGDEFARDYGSDKGRNRATKRKATLLEAQLTKGLTHVSAEAAIAVRKAAWAEHRVLNVKERNIHVAVTKGPRIRISLGPETETSLDSCADATTMDTEEFLTKHMEPLAARGVHMYVPKTTIKVKTFTGEGSVPVFGIIEHAPLTIAGHDHP